MSAEVWSIVTVGIVILIAIAASNRAMRREMNGRIDGLGKRVDGLGERLDGLAECVTGVRLEMSERFGEMNERIAAVRLEMVERFGEVTERLGRVEGLLEGIGFAQRKRAGKVRGDGERAVSLSQPSERRGSS